MKNKHRGRPKNSGKQYVIEQKKQIEHLASQGMSIPEISKHLGRSYYAVYSFCKNHCINTPNGHHGRPAMSQKQIDKIKTMTLNGMKVEEISNTLGLSRNTIYTKCRELNLPTNPGIRGAGTRQRTKMRLKTIKDLRNVGMSYNKIGQIWGISKQAVHQLCEKYNLG